MDILKIGFLKARYGYVCFFVFADLAVIFPTQRSTSDAGCDQQLQVGKMFKVDGVAGNELLLEFRLCLCSGLICDFPTCEDVGMRNPETQ